MVDFKAMSASEKGAKEVEAELKTERVDLFAWIDALFNKSRPEGAPPVYMMHRFLASDQVYAPVARWLQQQVREPDLVFGCWQAALPKQRNAPRFTYPAAKKPPAAELLVQRVMQDGGYRRAVAEQMIAIVDRAGRLDDLYTEYGIEPAESEDDS